MLISIVIPLFNKKDYIQRAIDSVLNQTHSDFELIVVDDGSTDGSAEVVRSFSDSRIRLILQPNSGVSSARNTGVMHAIAEWVSFLDADDEYLPDFLKQVTDFICVHRKANLSILGTNYFTVQEEAVVAHIGLKTGIYNYFEMFGNQRSPNHTSTTAVHKEKIVDVGGFPEGVGHFEDWIVWLKLSFVGSFGFIEKPLGKHHYVPGSISNSCSSVDFYDDAKRFSEIITDYAERYYLSPESKRAVWRCVNEFCINIAGMLADEGYKILAIKILKRVRIKYFLKKPVGRFRSLLLHLIVPQWAKKHCISVRNLLRHIVTSLASI